MTVVAVLTLVIVPLALPEIALWGGWLAKRVLRLAAFVHYGRTPRRSIRAEEWSCQLQDIPAPLSQLGYALGHLIAGFAAMVVRIGRRAWRRKRLDRDALLRALDPDLTKDPGVVWLDLIRPAEISPAVSIQAGEDPDLAWQDRALCADDGDPEAFFPEKGGTVRAAKELCARCDVRAECLQFALEHDERFGIWGGLTEKERRRLRGPAA